MRMGVKVSAITLIVLLCCTITSAFNVVQAHPHQTLRVIPTHTYVAHVYDTFNVDIFLEVPPGENITDFYGVQVNLEYNTTILDCLNASELAGNPLEAVGHGFHSDINEVEGYSLFALHVIDIADCVTVTEGNWPIARLEFNSTEIGNSPLNFAKINTIGGTYMLNSDATMIPFEVMNGDVEVSVPPAIVGGTTNSIESAHLPSWIALILFITSLVAAYNLYVKWKNLM